MGVFIEKPRAESRSLFLSEEWERGRLDLKSICLLAFGAMLGSSSL